MVHLLGSSGRSGSTERNGILHYVGRRRRSMRRSARILRCGSPREQGLELEVDTVGELGRMIRST